MANDNKFETTPRSQQERRRDTEPPTFVNNELRFQRWRMEQDRLDASDDRAWEEHHPGKTMFVTATPALATRRRAGLAFSNSGRTEVKVIDATDDEVRAIQATGAAVVNPPGAKAIADDTGPNGGLIVYDVPAIPDKPVEDLTEDELAARQAEERQRNATARAERAAARAARKSKSGEGRPERLGRGKQTTGEEPPKG